MRAIIILSIKCIMRERERERETGWTGSYLRTTLAFSICVYFSVGMNLTSVSFNYRYFCIYDVHVHQHISLFYIQQLTHIKVIQRYFFTCWWYWQFLQISLSPHSDKLSVPHLCHIGTVGDASYLWYSEQILPNYLFLGWEVVHSLELQRPLGWRSHQPPSSCHCLIYDTEWSCYLQSSVKSMWKR